MGYNEWGFRLCITILCNITNVKIGCGFIKVGVISTPVYLVEDCTNGGGVGWGGDASKPRARGSCYCGQ